MLINFGKLRICYNCNENIYDFCKYNFPCPQCNRINYGDDISQTQDKEQIIDIQPSLEFPFIKKIHCILNRVKL